MVTGRTRAALMAVASPAFATAAGVSARSDVAVQPTTVTAASVAAIGEPIVATYVGYDR